MVHSGRKSKQLIQINDGNFSFGKDVIFNDINLRICKKDKIALIGPNGAGNTTLINILRESLKLTSGVQNNLDQLKIITFDQKRESLDPNKTPFEIVGDGQDFVHLGDGTQKHVIAYLENFLFTRDQINRPTYTLSGGEKNRLQLAMFMRQSADLWIFDEPTNDLDIETIEILESELRSYDAAVIIIGHDRAFLDNICKTTWLINKKNIEMFDGGYSQVAPYLHALEMERKLEKSNPTPKEDTNTEKSTKMSYNDKARWDVIEAEIAQMEKSVKSLKEEMAGFNFTTNDESEKKSFEKLNSKFLDKESKLGILYAEWEGLSEKEV
jgi:ATP-binding cassette subfamily F protein uup